MFCEAVKVKVDASLSDDKLKKNAGNRISLLKVLFEDLSEALVWYEKLQKNCPIQNDLVSIYHSCSTTQMKVMI